jgi:hypothetical protein
MHIDHLKPTFCFIAKHGFLNLKSIFLFEAKRQEMVQMKVWVGYAEDKERGKVGGGRDEA